MKRPIDVLREQSSSLEMKELIKAGAPVVLVPIPRKKETRGENDCTDNKSNG